MSTGQAAPLIPVLPALDYRCARCGVQIHHDSDTAVVRLGTAATAPAR